jgi:ATP-binding protein involved in chromosome partitioning
MARSFKEEVLEALKKVKDPILGYDYVSADRVKNLSAKPDGYVGLTLVLTQESTAALGRIEKLVKQAILMVDGARFVDLKVEGPQGQAAGSSEPQQKPVEQKQAGMSIEGVKNIIAVSSGKGGVGKSTVSVNLAVALAQSGAKVGLMDADVHGPNIPTMLGVTDSPKIVEDPDLGERFLPPESYGLKVMSMGFLLPPDQPAIWRGPMLHNLLTQFCRNVDWGYLDYLVIDMPPGTGDVQISLAQLIPITAAVLVSTPQEVSMQDVRRAHQMWERVRVPMLGVVENMSYFECDGCEKKHAIFGSGGGKLLSDKLGLELLAEIPLVPHLATGGDEGRPLTAKAPESTTAKAFQALAQKTQAKIQAMADQSAGKNGPGGMEIGQFS